MKKIFKIFISTFIITMTFCSIFSVEASSKTGHKEFSDITFLYDESAKLLIKMSKNEKRQMLKNVKREAFGWSNYTNLYNRQVIYEANTIFSRSNNTRQSIEFKYSTTETEKKQTTKTQRFRHRDDLLYEADAQRFRQRNCARSGHAHFHAARAEFLPRFPHHLRQCLLRVCAVAAIFAPDHFSRFVQQHQLDGGRTDVNARIIIGVCFHSSTSSVGLSAATTSESARKMIGFSFCALCRFSHSEVQSESF